MESFGQFFDMIGQELAAILGVSGGIHAWIRALREAEQDIMGQHKPLNAKWFHATVASMTERREGLSVTERLRGSDCGSIKM